MHDENDEASKMIDQIVEGGDKFNSNDLERFLS